MCGFAGIINFSREAVQHSILQSMTESMVHRGPDGQGIFITDNVGLGHRRLAILDLSESGSQPMHSADRRWTIVYNGCIYNFKDLRRSMESENHVFRSQCDTEVVLEGLAAYGTTVFKRFNGMFALAAYNHHHHEILLCRDRYGIKPLYYYQDQQFLIFASEIKALLNHPAIHPEVDPDVLNEYFTFQNLFSFQTLFKNIHLLPPATTMKINTMSGATSCETWWDFNFSRPDETMDYIEARDETRRLFQQAVNRQLVSDVPVGSYLSGGIDSGSITSVASRTIPGMMTFTCGFDMSGVTGIEANFDERRSAELMASRFQTEHYEQVIHASNLRSVLPHLIHHLEDLRLGMSYPHFYISRLASKFLKVALQGTGGDELFGGYPWRYYRVFRSINQGDYYHEYYDYWQRLIPDTDKKDFFHPEIYRTMDLERPRSVFESVFGKSSDLLFDTPEQQIQNSLYFECKTFLHGLLIVGDRLSMAHGLEERYPFLDNDLVDFAQKIPVRYKLADLDDMKRIDENELQKKTRAINLYHDSKNILRDAMCGFLPDEICNRHKQGFSPPEESWFRGQNSSYIQETLLDSEQTLLTRWINPDFISNIVDEHMNHQNNHRLLLWSLISFEWWCRQLMKIPTT